MSWNMREHRDISRVLRDIGDRLLRLEQEMKVTTCGHCQQVIAKSFAYMTYRTEIRAVGLGDGSPVINLCKDCIKLPKFDRRKKERKGN